MPDNDSMHNILETNAQCGKKLGKKKTIGFTFICKFSLKANKAFLINFKI